MGVDLLAVSRITVGERVRAHFLVVRIVAPGGGEHGGGHLVAGGYSCDGLCSCDLRVGDGDGGGAGVGA